MLLSSAIPLLLAYYGQVRDSYYHVEEINESMMLVCVWLWILLFGKDSVRKKISGDRITYSALAPKVRSRNGAPAQAASAHTTTGYLRTDHK
jgi:hypothetical protein